MGTGIHESHRACRPIRRAVLRAIEVGYRHFDTAAHYETEAPIGEAAAEAVLRGDSLRSLSAVPAAFTERDMAGLYGNVGTNNGSSSSLHTSPENSTYAPARKRSKNSPGCGALGGQQQVKLPGPGPVLQSCELDLCLTPLSSPLAGGRRGGASDEYSSTTCCEDACGDAAEAGARGRAADRRIRRAAKQRSAGPEGRRWRLARCLTP